MVRFKYSKGALSGKNKSMYIPLVCIQKEGLGQSWDREQGCYLRRAVYSLSFASIRHARFQIGLRWNPKGTKPVFMFIEQTREGTSSAGMRFIGQELGISRCSGSLLIFPVHLHNALHSLGQFLHSHKAVLLLHGLQKPRQLLETEKNRFTMNL